MMMIIISSMKVFHAAVREAVLQQYHVQCRKIAFVHEVLNGVDASSMHHTLML